MIPWAAVDYDDAPEATFDQIGPTRYLVPDYEAPPDAEKVLKKVCDKIFCRELEDWYQVRGGVISRERN